MIFATLSALISLVFAIAVLRLYGSRRHTHTLVWGIALLMWFVAALTEVVASAADWNQFLFKVYYLLGGILLVGAFGLGSAMLLFPRVGKIYLAAFALAGLLAIVAVSLAPVEVGLLHTSGVAPDAAICGNLGSCPSAWSTIAVILAIVVNSAGTLFLVGGALYSAVNFALRRKRAALVFANIMIGLGALVVAAAASLTRFNVSGAFYAGQTVGLAAMFVGFVIASLPARVAGSVAAASYGQ